MNRFGWSLPAGVTTLPGEEEEEYLPAHCRHCGAFLPRNPVRAEKWEHTVPCTGQNMEPELLIGTYCGKPAPHDAHDVVEYCGTNFFYLCKRCGKETVFGD